MAVKSEKLLHVHIADDVSTVLADSESIEKIIENILSNALRYAKREVWLTAEKFDNSIEKSSDAFESVNDRHADCDEPERGVIIKIIDDGDGIKADELPHIFERHYKGEEGCFGFGLAIALAAAGKIDAVLTAENTEDKGACFTLLLKSRQ